jgi:hypothetical protein
MVGLFFPLLIDSCLCPRERRWGRLVVGETRSKKKRWGDKQREREREREGVERALKNFPLNHPFFTSPLQHSTFYIKMQKEMTKIIINNK